MTALMTAQSTFLRLYAPVQANLRAFLHAAVRDPHQTDDLAQQVGVVLWRKFDQYDPTRPFAGWAIGIARMELLKWRDRSARDRRVGSLSDDAVAALADAAAAAAEEAPTDHSAGPDAEDRAAVLATCVDRLAPAAKVAVQMKYRDGRPIRDIAAAQGRAVAAVEMALVRARRALKKCVESSLARRAGPGGRGE
ncbi:MAG TPA: sigma-70 family RNA polymerase sigma factor [Humisphaera sp.]